MSDVADIIFYVDTTCQSAGSIVGKGIQFLPKSAWYPKEKTMLYLCLSIVSDSNYHHYCSWPVSLLFSERIHSAVLNSEAIDQLLNATWRTSQLIAVHYATCTMCTEEEFEPAWWSIEDGYTSHTNTANVVAQMNGVKLYSKSCTLAN